jgi:hypothetical protein
VVGFMPGSAYSTRISISREVRDTSDPNGYGDLVTQVVAADVPAHIDFGSGQRATRQGGTFTDATFSLVCAPCELRTGDQVTDLTSGESYRVESAFHVHDLWQPHVQAGLEQASAAL